MKKQVIIRVLILFAVVAVLSCSQLDDLVDEAGAQVVVAILVSDGSDIKPFAVESGGKELNVSIQGEHKDLVKGSMQSDISLGTYVINTKIIEPSPEDPLEFTLVFSADGYLTTSKTYFIAAKSTNIDHVLMTNLASDNAGVDSVIIKEGRADKGIVETDLTVSTPKNRSSIFIPKGVTLKTGNGTPLEGDLTTTLAHFDASDPRALVSFPGSLDPIVTDEDGERRPVNFITAGYVSVDIIDESGNKAEKIEGGAIDIDIAASSTTRNPDKNRIIQAGDTIPFWSFNETTGEWDYESTLDIEEDSLYTPGSRSTINSLVVRTTLTHLSAYNLDYHQNACSISAPIQLQGRNKRSVTLDLLFENDIIATKIMVNEDLIYFNNAPENQKVIISATPNNEEMTLVEALIIMVKDMISTTTGNEELFDTVNLDTTRLLIDDLCDHKQQHSLQVKE